MEEGEVRRKQPPVPSGYPDEANLSLPGEENLLHGLPHLASREPLRTIRERYMCEGCQRSVRYYCYRCYKVAPCLREKDTGEDSLIPPISSSLAHPTRLPLPLTILKHRRELEGKSTAVHAKLLAPESVEIVPFEPQESAREVLPLAIDEKSMLLLFPSPEARSVSEVNWAHISRLVVIDGTWQQAKSMVASLREKLPMQCVRLQDTHETLFWRYQSIGPHCLSTIEAIYYFYRELEEALGAPQDPQLDNLLWFFSHQYELIQEDYRRNPERHYTARHRPDYIRHRLGQDEST